MYLNIITVTFFLNPRGGGEGRLISYKPLSFNWPEALPPVKRDGSGTHLRVAWCLQARGKSLWPL